jgi:hypothetical protein
MIIKLDGFYNGGKKNIMAQQNIPSVIFSNMHPRDFDAFCIMFNRIGWKVYIPSAKEPNYFGYGSTTAPSKGDYTAITYQEFLDIKPNVVLCLCWEQIGGATKMARESGSTLVVRAGNNNLPYNHSHSNFLISNDTHTYNRCDIKNKLLFYLPPDYDFYTKQIWQQNSFIVSSYIHHYSRYWKNSWDIYDNIRRNNIDIAFLGFGVSGDDVYSPHLVYTEDIRRTLSISRCMLHIKELEGYGWSLLEAVSCGIPVIALKSFVVGKTCENFLIEGKTVVFLQDGVTDFRKAFNNTDLLYEISEAGPKFIREFINPDEQYEKIKKFFEEIVLS